MKRIFKLDVRIGSSNIGYCVYVNAKLGKIWNINFVKIRRDKINYMKSRITTRKKQYP